MPMISIKKLQIYNCMHVQLVLVAAVVLQAGVSYRHYSTVVQHTRYCFNAIIG